MRKLYICPNCGNPIAQKLRYGEINFCRYCTAPFKFNEIISEKVPDEKKKGKRKK